MQSHINSLLWLGHAQIICLSLLLAQPSSSWVHNPQQKPQSRNPLSMLVPSSQISQTIATRHIRLSPFQNRQRHFPTATATALSLSSSVSDNESSKKIGDGDKEKEDAWYENLDVLLDEGDDLYGDDTEEDWTPDAEKAKGRRPRNSRELIPAKEVLGDSFSDTKQPSNGEKSEKQRPSPYTEEEEELIAAMGGKGKKEKASPREIGYLGDSTLRDISRDYSVPICYLADVLAMWGVAVPINVHDRLGDLVTGEQAFALVEAVNTLDMGNLNDRYSNQNMLQLCDGWDIDIKDAFEFSMNEGWSLPFGVRTNLRVEQEDELLRVFSTLYREVDDD